MKTVIGTLKTTGVLTCTGAMAMVGFIVGVIIFEPEHIKITRNK